MTLITAENVKRQGQLDVLRESTQATHNTLTNELSELKTQHAALLAQYHEMKADARIRQYERDQARTTVDTQQTKINMSNSNGLNDRVVNTSFLSRPLGYIPY